MQEKKTEQVQFGPYKAMDWEEYGVGYRSSYWFVVNVELNILENCCMTRQSAIEKAKEYRDNDLREMNERMDDLLTIPESKE